jgi:opacity protein-like surface antigen
MSRGLALAAAAAFIVVAAAPLHAADLLPPLPALDEPLLAAEPIGAGWYLRGDIGLGATRNARATHDGFPIRGTLDRARFGTGASFGGGFGYRYNEFLRVDLTIDHRFDANFTGASSHLGGVLQLRDRAKFSATTGLVNAYVDLGSWGSITPYVGGGLGMSSNRVANYVIDACAVSCDAGRVELGRLPGKARNDLAWALMAGLAVDAGHGAIVDLGYRYLNLGKARTGVDPVLGGVKLSRIESHEFRVGLRWSFASTGRGY